MPADAAQASEETAADEVEVTTAETTAEPEVEATEEIPAAEPSEQEQTPGEIESNYNAYRRAVKEFGVELTETAFDNGGYESVEKAYFAKLADENKALAEKVKALESGETASEFSEKTTPKKLFNTQK